MTQTHLNLDDAWTHRDQFISIDLRSWGPRLRYHGKRGEVDDFYRAIKGRLAPFVMYGSGDFHYLAGVLLRRIDTPVTVISFDNHPDWDVRPPHWSCGGWVNRALELPHVQRVSIWGCGNFELQFPSRLFANHRALRSGRLKINAWCERQPLAVQRRFDCMTRDDWRDRFAAFAQSLIGYPVYVTVDLDCLTPAEAITNWEQGLFTAADVAWALQYLREHVAIIAGDLCGAFSPPVYARRFQRFAGEWDHPKLPAVDPAIARRINDLALDLIWPALVASR